MLLQVYSIQLRRYHSYAGADDRASGSFLCSKIFMLKNTCGLGQGYLDIFKISTHILYY